MNVLLCCNHPYTSLARACMLRSSSQKKVPGITGHRGALEHTAGQWCHDSKTTLNEILHKDKAGEMEIHICLQRRCSAVAMVIASTATGCVAQQEASPMRWGGPLVSAMWSRARTSSSGVVQTKTHASRDNGECGMWCVCVSSVASAT